MLRRTYLRILPFVSFRVGIRDIQFRNRGRQYRAVPLQRFFYRTLLPFGQRHDDISRPRFFALSLSRQQTRRRTKDFQEPFPGILRDSRGPPSTPLVWCVCVCVCVCVFSLDSIFAELSGTYRYGYDHMIRICVYTVGSYIRNAILMGVLFVFYRSI